MKKFITLILLVGYQVMVAQDVCTENHDEMHDANSIDKCLIDNDSHVKITKTNKATITNEVYNRRYLKKRVYFEKVTAISDAIKPTTTIAVNHTNELAQYKLRNLLPIHKVEEEQIISFNTVDEIPMFTTCSETLTDKVDCFNYEMQKHILTTLVYPNKALKNGVEGEVYLSFVINEVGKITNVEAKGVSEVLKEEAVRIVSLLPNFYPGKQKGAPVKVQYSFPINFTLD